VPTSRATFFSLNLLEMEHLVVSDDAGRILPTVLQGDQSLVQVIDRVLPAANPKHAAHG
jgi:hypothetical protein